MIDGLQMTFHHIGKAVPLDEIKDNAHTKYSPLYDMYSLDTTNDLSVPIELHAFGPGCSLDRRIQTGTHVGFKVNDVKVALQGQGGASVAPETVRAVEDAILTRARQLRVRDSKL